MADDFKLTVAWDFDGVIHPYTAGWQGPTPADEPPNMEVIEVVRWCRNVLDLRTVIFSTRAADKPGLFGIVDWLNRYEIADLFDDITHEKPPAVAYVDDRAVAFDRDLNVAVACETAAEAIMKLCRADGRFKDPYAEPNVDFIACCEEMSDAREMKFIEIRGGELVLAGRHPEAASNVLTGVVYNPRDVVLTMALHRCPWCGIEVIPVPANPREEAVDGA